MRTDNEIARAFLNITSSPELYLKFVSIDLEMAYFVKMEGPQDYRKLYLSKPTIKVSLERLLSLFESVTVPHINPIKFIFMTDYCCSTLLINLMSELRGCFTLSEPTIFASLSRAKRALDATHSKESDLKKWQRVLELAMHLISRSYSPPETVIVKEWPVASYIIGNILGCGFRSSAIFMYSDLRSYLISVLKKEIRRKLMRFRVKDVFSELNRYPALKICDVQTLRDPQLAVLHWLITLQNISAAQNEAPNAPIRSLNCEVLISQPEATLWAVARHFGLSPDGAEIRSVINGPVYNTYSKENDPTLLKKKYNWELRDRDMKKTFRVHRAEIEAGLKWAESIVSKNQIASLLPLPLDVPNPCVIGGACVGKGGGGHPIGPNVVCGGRGRGL